MRRFLIVFQKKSLYMCLSKKIKRKKNDFLWEWKKIQTMTPHWAVASQIKQSKAKFKAKLKAKQNTAQQEVELENKKKMFILVKKKLWIYLTQ